MKNILKIYENMYKEGFENLKEYLNLKSLMQSKITYSNFKKYSSLDGIEHVFKFRDRGAGGTTFAEFVAIRKALAGKKIIIASPYALKSMNLRYKYDNANIVKIHRDSIVLDNYGSITLMKSNLLNFSRGIKIDYLILDDYKKENYDKKIIDKIKRESGCAVIKIHKDY